MHCGHSYYCRALCGGYHTCTSGFEGFSDSLAIAASYDYIQLGGDQKMTRVRVTITCKKTLRTISEFSCTMPEEEFRAEMDAWKKKTSR